MMSIESLTVPLAPARVIPPTPRTPAATSFGAREFFLAFFGALEERGIAYVVLHGFEDFPDRFDSDVDYAVAHSDLRDAENVLAVVARKHGWVIAQCVVHELFATYRVVVDQDDASHHLALDVCSHFAKDGCLLLSDEVLLHGRRKHPRGFYVPAYASEFAHLLGKSLLKPAAFGKYIARLRELAELDRAGAEQHFAQLCGDDAHTLDHFLQHPKSDYCVLRANLRRRTRFAPRLRLAELVRRGRRVLRPSGLHISLLGPDGSGKSTLLRNLDHSLAPLFEAQRVYKFRPDVLNQIGAESKVTAHERAPRSAIFSWAKTLFYFADWWVGYVTKLLPDRRRGRLVIFDRDFADLAVDQRRYLMQGSGALASLLLPFLPRADATFVLDADAAAIHARKPELPVAELQRQRTAFRRLAARDFRIQVVNGNAPAEDVARNVTREVLQLLARREHRRSLPRAKRLFDAVVAGCALVLLSPLLAVLALLIRLNLGTPVLFRQERPGLHGVPFMMRKFRTMTDARDERGRLLPDIERVTRFGRFLRSTSLDELPELLNVWRGEMSLVGPRPLLMEYLPLYSAEQMRRHDVQPGITGWAQINGRNAASWPRKFALDVWYVDHHSLGLDLKILALTFLKVVKREGISQPGRFSSDRFRGEQTESAVGEVLV